MANGLLVDQPLGELLAAFASRNPTPGGGSASALAASLGAALLLMVGAMPKTRLGTEEDRVALDTAVAALIPIQHRLTAAVDADAAAYAQVVAAYKQPKTTQPEREARLASVQRALRAATDVPLDVMRLSVAALEQAGAIAEHGHRAAASDVGVAVALLHAGLRGANLNVETNLTSVTDTAYFDAVRAEIERLAGKAAVLARQAEEALR